MYPRNTRNTRKEIHVCAIPRRLEIQQEITEKTEDRSNLCSIRCLLFKRPSVARSCRTSSSGAPGERARKNSKAQTGVAWSIWFGDPGPDSRLVAMSRWFGNLRI